VAVKTPGGRRGSRDATRGRGRRRDEGGGGTNEVGCAGSSHDAGRAVVRVSRRLRDGRHWTGNAATDNWRKRFSRSQRSDQGWEEQNTLFGKVLINKK
jgi:hypothetical protein